jgi:Helicase conserved C-terminal domain
MSYLDVSSNDFIDNLLLRKEFYSLKIDPERNFRDPADADEDPITARHLKISSYQLFVGNFINPNTPYMRLHLKFMTGGGKTLGALYAAHKFIGTYRKLYAVAVSKVQSTRKNLQELDRELPTVFVLGFEGTKNAFLRDLMKYPEFGFITLGEKEELVKRQNLASSGMPDDLRYYREYYAVIKKRITNKSRGGFFKFFGYDEFVNRIFHSDTISLTDLETIVANELKAGRETTLEAVFQDHIERGIITVNTAMVEMFKNSLLIGDEIHNTYNMNMKNNRGVAIQYILDSVPSLRFLSLSATPINNSPTEVVDWINYLVPTSQKVTKKELFVGRNLLPGKLEFIGKLLQGRVSFLQDVNIKYFPKSEFVGADIVLAHDIGDIATAGSKIPYLKFIDCPMSRFHQNTLNEYQRNPLGETTDVTTDVAADVTTDVKPLNLALIDEGAAEGVGEGVSESAAEVTTEDTVKGVTEYTTEGVTEEADEEPTYNILTAVNSAIDSDEVGVEPEGEHPYPAIPTDGYSIYDIAFPNPQSTNFGIFRSSEVRGKLLSASSDWRDKNKISVKKYSSVNYAITGDFLQKSSVKQYSTKYYKILDTLDAILDPNNNDPTKCQKVMIYHDRVKMSGVLLIQELLRANGFIDEFMSPVDTTRCCICGKPLSEHKKPRAEGGGSTDRGGESVSTGGSMGSGSGSGSTNGVKTHHEFLPARFVIAHSDIERPVMNQSLVKFNSTDNSHGTSYMILVGSKIIKESYDFKDIQHLILTSLPVNIPTFLQVIGRCIRKSSHINLPPDQRRVRIYILVSTVNREYEYTDEISPEVYRYVDKLADYIIIQNIEREILRTAIDADLNRDIIMPPDLLATYFPPGVNGPVNMLGNLYFDPAHTIPKDVTSGKITETTFITGKYFEEEIRTICFILKRLFMHNPVWTYEQLWEQVRKPKMGIEVNPALFSEHNFIIALENLVKKSSSIVSAKSAIQSTILLERLFDYSDKYIYVGGQKMMVDKIGQYYITFPVTTAESDQLNTVVETKEIVRDRERALIKSAPKLREHPIIDVEMYIRANVPDAGIAVSIDGFIADNRSNVTYLSRRNDFIRNVAADTVDTADTELMINFLSNYTDRFQIAFIEEAIISSMKGAVSVVGGTTDTTDTTNINFAFTEEPTDTTKEPADTTEEPTDTTDTTDTKATTATTVENKTGGAITIRKPEALYTRILQFMDQFKVLITASEVRKYKDTAKQYKNGVPSVEGPIGYMTARVIRLYDPDDERWIEVSKIALNRQVRYKENEVVIGYFETVEDSMKFKMRSPVQKIDVKKAVRGKATINDTRLIERGIVCTTKNKQELLNIISKLGISASKLDKSELRIKKLCSVIMRHLIERELRERQKDTRYKFLYSWWDEMPDLTKME